MAKILFDLFVILGHNVCFHLYIDINHSVLIR